MDWILQQTTLAHLDQHKLRDRLAWRWTGMYDAAGDEILEPVHLTSAGRIPATVGEVFCFCLLTFNDNSQHPGCAMCRGDSSLGPIALSAWNDNKSVRLLLPPAPGFVLEKEGPGAFCSEFGRDSARVFPLKITVIPHFAKPPNERVIRIAASGEYRAAWETEGG